MADSSPWKEVIWKVCIITPTREVLDVTDQVDEELLKDCYFAEEIAGDLENKYGMPVSVEKIEKVTKW